MKVCKILQFLFISHTWQNGPSARLECTDVSPVIMWHSVFPPSELDCHVNITDGEKEVDPRIYSCLNWHGVHTTCNM